MQAVMKRMWREADIWIMQALHWWPRQSLQRAITVLLPKSNVSWWRETHIHVNGVLDRL